MGFLSTIGGVIADAMRAYAPKGSVPVPAGAKVELTVGKTAFTFAELQATINLAKTLMPVLTELEKLAKGYGPDVKQDLIITDQIVALVAAEASQVGIPYAGDIEIGAEILGFILQLLPDIKIGPGRPGYVPPPGSNYIAGADWSHGFPWSQPQNAPES